MIHFSTTPSNIIFARTPALTIAYSSDMLSQLISSVPEQATIGGIIHKCCRMSIWQELFFLTVPIPNLRGCSVYKTTETGILKSGFDVTKAPIKLPREAANFLSLLARLLFGSL